MKGGREHRVPLVGRSRELIAELERSCRGEVIFPGLRDAPLSNMATHMLLRRMERDDITVHGFRSTFRDWAGDRTNFQREVNEEALSHSVGNKVEQAYRRGDALEKRRALMATWDAFCTTPPASDVVPIHA